MRNTTYILAGALTLIASCSRTDIEGHLSDGDIPEIDAIPDSWPDTAPDVPPPDIWPDFPPDLPPPDIWPDFPPDTRPDPPPDIWPDFPPDTRPDPPWDTRPDWLPDPPWDTRPDWLPDIWPDWPPDVPTDSVSGFVGERCGRDADCMGVPTSGRMCLESVFGYIEFPNGYCSGSCTSDPDCGPGGECVSLFIGSYCLKTCTMFFECRFPEGYSCMPLGPGGSTYCLPPFGGPDGGPVDP